MDNIASDLHCHLKLSLSLVPQFFFFLNVKITERTERISLYLPLDSSGVNLWPHLLASSVCVCVVGGGRVKFFRAESFESNLPTQGPITSKVFSTFRR